MVQLVAKLKKGLLNSLVCSCGPYLNIIHSNGSVKTLKSLCMKVRTPAGSMKPLSHPAAPHALMKPSQVVCSGCRSEDSPLSLDVLFPGEGCRLHVCFPSTLKGHIHLRPRGEREHGIWRYVGRGGQCYFETKCTFGMCKQARVVLTLLYIYFFLMGTCIPSQTKMGFGGFCNEWLVFYLLGVNGLKLQHSKENIYKKYKETIEKEWLIFSCLNIHMEISAVWASPVLFIRRQLQRNELKSCNFPSASESFQTLKMKSGIQVLNRAAVMRVFSHLSLSFFFSLLTCAVTNVCSRAGSMAIFCSDSLAKCINTLNTQTQHM